MKEIKKPELLAPAGNMDCLKAAIEAGCDAVYLSGKMYGARSFAGNFSNEEIVEAINYSHLYGVKVYITINTIVYEREVERFLNFVRFIHKNNVDAVIVQDIGMFDLLRKKFPNLELHASTQMHIHNYEGAILAKKLGFKRIVLARETSLSIIKKIKEDVDIEVEAFVHGALCVSYSGQCLLSASIGNRSGNRGTCAQCCRKKYTLYDKKGNKLNYHDYLLSTKELCTLPFLDKLIESGIDSFKIEGRMRRREYVYLITKLYRKAIDSYFEYGKININKEDILEIKKMFNRDLTPGFMFDIENNSFTYEKRPNHIGIEVGRVIKKRKNKIDIKLSYPLNLNDGIRFLDDKEDKGLILTKMFINNKMVNKASAGDVLTIYYDKYVKEGALVLLTTDYNQISGISNHLKKLKRLVPIDIYFEAKENKKMLINVSDGKNKVILSMFEVHKSINKPTTKIMVEEHLRKTGNTIYEANNITINMDSNLFIGIKDINEIRRRALEKLNEKRLYKIEFLEKDYYTHVKDYEVEKKTSALFNDKKAYDTYKDNYDLVYVSDKSLKGIYKVPRVVNNYEKIDDMVLVGEFGSLMKYKNLISDFSFNVVNSYSVAFLHELGVLKVTLSHELNFNKIKDIIDAYHNRYHKHPNIEVIKKSKVPVMICKYDLNKKYDTNMSYLQDEYKNKYLVKSFKDYMEIYDYKEKDTIDKEKLYEIGINYVRDEYN